MNDSPVPEWLSDVSGGAQQLVRVKTHDITLTIDGLTAQEVAGVLAS